jgi:hypothetical protein
MNVNANQVESLKSQVTLLRQKLGNASIGRDIQTQLEELISRSNQVYTYILESHIFNLLRFESMDDRFDEVSNVHEETFRWILEPNQNHNLLTPENFHSIAGWSLDQVFIILLVK